MNQFFQTLISATAVLEIIVIVYFSFRSFIRTITGKGAGCHGANDSKCDHCTLPELKDNVKKQRLIEISNHWHSENNTLMVI